MSTEPTPEQLLAYERAQTRLVKFQLERERNRHEREKREWQMEKVMLLQRIAMAEAASNTFRQMFLFCPTATPQIKLTIGQKLLAWWNTASDQFLGKSNPTRP